MNEEIEAQIKLITDADRAYFEGRDPGMTDSEYEEELAKLHAMLKKEGI